MDDESGMIRETGWQVDDKVNRDKNGEADKMNLEVDSKDKIMHIYMQISVWAICDKIEVYYST